MCWCRPEIRTPFCGRPECHAPAGHYDIHFPEIMHKDWSRQTVGERTRREIEQHLDQMMDLLSWATGGDTGVSSEAILRFMMRFPASEVWSLAAAAPSDAADRGRCVRLINRLYPEMRSVWIERLNDMRSLHKDWDEQITLILEELGVGSSTTSPGKSDKT